MQTHRQAVEQAQYLRDLLGDLRDPDYYEPRAVEMRAPVSPPIREPGQFKADPKPQE